MESDDGDSRWRHASQMLGGILFAEVVSDMGPRTIKMDATQLLYDLQVLEFPSNSYSPFLPRLDSAKPADS